MDDEYQALATQIDQVATNTQWNKMNILTGSGGEVGLASAFTFQIGANAGQVISVGISNQGIVSLGTTLATQYSTISGTALTTGQVASAAVAKLDDALSTLNTNRSKIGAAVNRLEHAIDNLTNVAQNTTDARSRVTDTDYSKATSDLARQQIIQQAGTAMLAQANQQPSTVLALLR
jgi:flagellin